MKGNALVTQTGGPTSTINASLCGIINQSLQEKSIRRIFGCRWGVLGLLEEVWIDLSKENNHVIRDLKQTPSSALGSSRYKLTEKDLPRVLELFKKHDIRYFFGIGGNDTMLNVFQIELYCRTHGHELYGMGCPKTVDNDLFGTDHTPGFPSAARYVALSVLQSGLLAHDMQKVDQFVIHQSIGRDVGWLAGASCAFKQEESEPPHILLIPETDFQEEAFLRKFDTCYQKYGYVSIVCGEGIHYPDGQPLSASHVKDPFANIEFGAMGGGSAALALHRMLATRFKLRGEFQITESLAMCAADRATAQDIEEAYELGKIAVKKAVTGASGLMTTLVRKSQDPYSIEINTIPLDQTAGKTKPIPREWIDPDGMMVNEKFGEYIRPLVGPKPSYAKLSCRSIY